MPPPQNKSHEDFGERTELSECFKYQKEKLENSISNEFSITVNKTKSNKQKAVSDFPKLTAQISLPPSSFLYSLSSFCVSHTFNHLQAGFYYYHSIENSLLITNWLFKESSSLPPNALFFFLPISLYPSALLDYSVAGFVLCTGNTRMNYALPVFK